MRRYLWVTSTVLSGIIFSGFSFIGIQKKGGRLNTCWYNFVGPQTVSGRETSANYDLVSMMPVCVGSGNECAVELTNAGVCPQHPDFSNITFDPTTGFPNGNKTGHTSFVTNYEMD